MALDEALLEAMPRIDRPVLRFYEWSEPAASFGYFQKFAEVSGLTPLRPLVRRPTGGGLVPHQADWTYSLAFFTNHEWYGLAATESYRRVHAWLQESFTLLGVTTELAREPSKEFHGQCFVGYEKSDLLWRGRKIGGAAQRRRRDGLLIQGSVQPPPGPRRSDWQMSMVEVGRKNYGIDWAEFKPDALLQKRVEELANNKYGERAFNQKR
jgi:lipoate-protein ligase A